MIPFSISSVANRNNYQPTPMDAVKASTLKQKLVRLLDQITPSNWALYETDNAVASKK
ncbi:hypothetical protein ACNQFZ_00815 [Schinkia sp. CFF1]